MKKINKPKFTTFYKIDGQIWTVEAEVPSRNMYDFMSKEDYDKRPDELYFLETNKGLVKCDKDKNPI